MNASKLDTKTKYSRKNAEITIRRESFFSKNPKKVVNNFIKVLIITNLLNIFINFKIKSPIEISISFNRSF